MFNHPINQSIYSVEMILNTILCFFFRLVLFFFLQEIENKKTRSYILDKIVECRVNPNDLQSTVTQKSTGNISVNF